MTRQSNRASHSLDVRERPISALAARDAYGHATILFVDMVGFTAFCAANDPADVIAMLRQLLGILSEEVVAHGGSVEKLLGDGMMAVFHATTPRSRHATNAVTCAISMQKAVAKWNAQCGRYEGRAIQIAVGIHSGPVIIGALENGGCEELAILGDAVNVASRVEGKCRCLNAAILVTSQVMKKISAEGGMEIVKRFANFGFQELRGRTGYLHLFGQRRS